MRSRWRRWLEAERDGELRGWRRPRLRRALARSPELRAERAALEAIGEAIRAAERSDTGPTLWPGIERVLERADREGARAAAPPPTHRRRTPSWARRRVWLPAGAVAAAAVAVATLAWWRTLDVPSEGSGTAAAVAGRGAVGRVLSLDTGGRPVWVQEGDGATIIWLVGGGADEV